MVGDGYSAQGYLQAIEQNLARLPLLPAVVSQILALKPESDNFLDRVNVLARQDPTFSARLIQYANKTVGYGSFVKEISIQHAIARLGARNIARMAVSLSLMEAFVPKSKSDSDLWVHSVLVAVTAQHLASSFPDLKVDPDHLYLGGLLHDIGRFIIFQAVPEGPSRIVETELIDPPSLLGSEINVCGVDHVEIGVQACRKWEMPNSIIEIVKNHHEVDLPHGSSAEQSLYKRVCLIQLADLFSLCLMRWQNEVAVEGVTLEVDVSDFMVELKELASKSCVSLPYHDDSMLLDKLGGLSGAIISESSKLLGYLGIRGLSGK